MNSLFCCFSRKNKQADVVESSNKTPKSKEPPPTTAAAASVFSSPPSTVSSSTKSPIAAVDLTQKSLSRSDSIEGISPEQLEEAKKDPAYAESIACIEAAFASARTAGQTMIEDAR